LSIPASIRLPALKTQARTTEAAVIATEKIIRVKLLFLRSYSVILNLGESSGQF
jgi:hypothetical protein